MKNIYVIVNEVKDIVEAYEDYSVCELAYIKMVNEDIKNRWLLVVTIDKWTDTIEHQYFRYDTSTTDWPCHMYVEYDTNYSIYMKEITLNSNNQWQWEKHDVNINNQK